MRISIRKTFKNVFSNRYNKANILICALILLLPQAIMSLCGSSENSLASIIGIIAILFVVISLFALIGNITFAIRNAMFNKKFIFPSIFDSFFQKFLKGILFLIGDTLSNIIANIIFIGIAVWMAFQLVGSSGITSILMFIAIIVLGILIAIIHTLISLNFAFDLKFGSLFKYKEIFSNLRKHCGLVLLFSIKSVFIFFLIAIPIVALFFIGQLPFYSPNEIIPNFMKNSSLLQQVVYLAFMPFGIDLAGQVGYILFDKKIEAIKEKILKKKNARMMAKKEQ